MRSLALARMLHEPSVRHLASLLRAHTPLDQAAQCLNVAPMSLYELLEQQTALESDPHVVSRAVHDEQSMDSQPLTAPDITPLSHRLNPFNATDQRQTKGWQDAIKDLLDTTPDLPEDLIIAIRTYTPTDPLLSKAAKLLPGVGWHDQRVIAQSQLPEDVHELDFELQVVLLKNIRRVDRARGESQAELTQILAKQAKEGNLRALTFLLERSDPRNWAPTSPRPPINPNAPTRTPGSKGTLPNLTVSSKGTRLTQNIEGMTEEQIRERVEALLHRPKAVP
jgi:putative NIF3 family GTP cyclohydrolase 1 type 2